MKAINTIDEIKDLENRMIQAELGPDPKFFEEVLADEVLLDGQLLKAKVVAAHTPGQAGQGPKFTKVEMSNYKIIDHGDAVVVTCTGTYESLQWSGTLKFMRVWLKRNNRWQIIAGATLK